MERSKSVVFMTGPHISALLGFTGSKAPQLYSQHRLKIPEIFLYLFVCQVGPRNT